MRNWNPYSNKIEDAFIKFPAYLWGIETVSPLPSIYIIYRSQPTYEELKPVQLEKVVGDDAGSQPTYEELKRGRQGIW